MSELLYSKTLRIRSEQVDMTRFLRVSELFRLMEEASIAHTEALGFPRQTTLDRGLLWVITRQSAMIEELPRYDDEITVLSWPGEMMHVFFPRFYQIKRRDQVLVRGQALWMLIHEDTRDMVMPEDYGIEIPGLKDSPEPDMLPVRKPASCEDVFYEEELVTRFSQTDINGHMNNTRYFDLIDDALPEEVRTVHAPWQIRAEYLSELRYKDTFTLRGYNGEDARYFEGSADRSKFRVLLEY